MRCQATDREERADDRARSCNPERDSESPDHPFAVLRDAAAPDIPKSEAKKNQKQQSEQRCRGGFIRAPDRRRVAQSKGGNADGKSQRNQKPSGPAVPADVALANASNELERHQSHEQAGGKNVRQRERLVLREACIHRGSGGETG